MDSENAAPSEGQPAPKEADTQTDTKTAVTDRAEIKQAPSQTWPDDWREKIAGEDTKTLERLKRFGSFNDVWKSYTNAEKKLSEKAAQAGDPYPEKGSDEDKNAWRSRNGIPDKPEAYVPDYTVDEIVIGEMDRPYVNEVLTAAHKENASPKVVKAMLKSYFEGRERQIQEITKADESHRMAVRDEFRDEYGPQAQIHFQAAKSVIDRAPQEIQSLITEARLPNGRKAGNDPGFVRWLVDLAKEINPAATVMPGSPAKSAKGVEDRISELRKMMGDDHSEYNRGPKSESLQKEYRDLITMQEKLRGKK